ncbi:hypothetical protein QAD02_000768 [Eretmocerus hayati]|uniref:Uncharacterized protein n=1 Tax=Eretmocerus hayati TaxID=131215 RepID=A0ACC2NEK4_9HYME|nr:hypothetical protein QAD02_000768 [Eretmocerus hayati]
MTDKTISYIERDVRSDRYIVPEDANVEDYIGRRPLTDKKNFQFTLPERDIFLLIRNAITSKTESWWCKQLRVNEGLNLVQQEADLDQTDNGCERNVEVGSEGDGLQARPQDMQSVRTIIDEEKVRIRENLKHSTDNKDIHEIFDSLLIDIVYPVPVSVDWKKKLTADIKCVESCNELIKVQYQSGRSWNTGNFLRHYYLFHPPASGPGRKAVKKRRTKSSTTFEVAPEQRQDGNSDVTGAEDVGARSAPESASNVGENETPSSPRSADDSGIASGMDNSVTGLSLDNSIATTPLPSPAGLAPSVCGPESQGNIDGSISVDCAAQAQLSIIQLSDFAHA